MSRILIVDDDPHVTEELTLALESFGYSVTTLLDPQYVFELLDKEPADLILLDVHMPVLDGVSLLKQLKDHAPFQAVPVIMLTVDVEKELLARCFEAGAVDFINKPVEWTTLKALVRSALANHNHIQEIEKINEQLVSANRELQETQAQLVQSQKMQVIGTLAGGIAHNFNNILVPIFGYTDMTMQNLHPGTREHQNLERVMKSANRAKKLVAQILLFGRKAEFRQSSLELDSMVQEGLSLLSKTLPSSITIKKKMPAKLPRIMADASQLGQVLMNLCVNSSHAMPEGGELLVRAERVMLRDFTTSQGHLLSGQYVKLSVKDNGLGMDENTLKHSADPFFTTKGPREGIGLGLSVVQGIVERHRGGIGITSRLGAGTTVDVFLPVTSSKGDETPPLLEEDDKSSPTPKSILLVEDEAEVRGFLKKACSCTMRDSGSPRPKMQLMRWRCLKKTRMGLT